MVSNAAVLSPIASSPLFTILKKTCYQNWFCRRAPQAATDSNRFSISVQTCASPAHGVARHSKFTELISSASVQAAPAARSLKTDSAQDCESAAPAKNLSRGCSCAVGQGDRPPIDPNTNRRQRIVNFHAPSAAKRTPAKSVFDCTICACKRCRSRWKSRTLPAAMPGFFVAKVVRQKYQSKAARPPTSVTVQTKIRIARVSFSRASDSSKKGSEARPPIRQFAQAPDIPGRRAFRSYGKLLPSDGPVPVAPGR